MSCQKFVSDSLIIVSFLEFFSLVTPTPIAFDMNKTFPSI